MSTAARLVLVTGLRIIDRNLQYTTGNISADWLFGIAYNAALKLCTILLYAEAYRPVRGLASGVPLIRPRE